MLSGPDDALTRALLAKYREGDQDAATRLFNAHKPFLLRAAQSQRSMRFLRRHCDPEDLVAEVFERALATGFLDRFEDRGQGSLLAALYTILDRVIADNCRRHGALKRRANIGRSFSGEDQGGGNEGFAVRMASFTSDPTPTSDARVVELRELCRREMSPREWQVWQLVEQEGLAPTDVAERLNETPASIRGVLHRARERMMKILIEKDWDRRPPGA